MGPMCGRVSHRSSWKARIKPLLPTGAVLALEDLEVVNMALSRKWNRANLAGLPLILAACAGPAAGGRFRGRKFGQRG